MSPRKESQVVVSKGALSTILSGTGSGSQSDVVAAVNTFILSQPTTSRKLEAARSIFDVSESASELIGAAVVEAWSVIFQHGLWKEEFASENEAKGSLDNHALRTIRTSHSSLRKRKEKAIAAIRSAWTTDVKDLDLAELGETALETMAGVAKTLDFDSAVHCVWHVVIDRLQRNQGGRASTKRPEKKDWQCVRQMTHTQREELLQRESIEDIDIGKYGLAARDLNIAPRLAGAPALIEGSRKRNATQAFGVQRPADRRVLRSSGRILEKMDVDEDDEDDEDDQTPDDEVSESECSENSQMEDGDTESELEAGYEELSDVPADPAFKCCPSHRRMESAAFGRVTRKTTFQSNTNTESGQLSLLAEFVKADTQLRGFCRYHLGRLAAKLGLKTQGVSGRKIASRLEQCWQKRGDLVVLKEDPETRVWWHRAARPSFTADALGVYSHERVAAAPFELSESRAKEIVLAVQPGAWSAFAEDGNIILRNFFAYVWEGVEVDGHFEAGIGGLVDMEFDMYIHHQGERNGNSNKGWLRTMFYSLTQQTIRQDLGYWMVYAALRPDRNYRLISYPYYAKYAVPGDKTSFRHLDLNVNKYLESGRGGEIIQGSVSLDDEDEEGCTELVLGFHKKVGQWWGRVQARDDTVDGWVTGLNKRYEVADAKEFGEFIAVPCSRGDARITMPQIPHGSTGPQQTARRTILPWFVGLQPDMEHLDNDESDTWSQLAVHYLTMTAPRSTPSGLENRYGPPPYKFPAATQMLLQSRVSCALICQSTWTDPMVEREVEVLLGEDREKAWSLVLRGRVDALRQFKKLWPVVREAEMKAYGSKSFFKQ